MHEDPLATLTRDLADLGRRARAAGSETHMDPEIFAELRAARVRQRATLVGKAFALAASVILGATVLSVIVTLNAARALPRSDDSPPADRARVQIPPAATATSQPNLAALNRANAALPSPGPSLEQLTLPEATSPIILSPKAPERPEPND